MNNSHYTQHSLVGKMIKRELRTMFGNVKFSVQTSRDAIDVSWTDGPTGESVKKIISKYQIGYFNTIDDTYVYSNRRSDIPQVRNVFLDRVLSAEVEEAIKKEYHFGEKNIWNDLFGCWNGDAVYKVFATLAF
jgi:hypothetical protein